MNRRWVIILLLLVTVLQGPALTYAASLGSGAGNTIQGCDDYTFSNGKDCDSCCSHGSMPSCVVQCAIPAGAAPAFKLPLMLRVGVRGVLLPDIGVARFAEHALPRPLRPPIV
jgi:hypothetical protein